MTSRKQTCLLVSRVFTLCMLKCSRTVAQVDNHKVTFTSAEINSVLEVADFTCLIFTSMTLICFTLWVYRPVGNKCNPADTIETRQDIQTIKKTTNQHHLGYKFTSWHVGYFCLYCHSFHSSVTVRHCQSFQFRVFCVHNHSLSRAQCQVYIQLWGQSNQNKKEKSDIFPSE